MRARLARMKERVATMETGLDRMRAVPFEGSAQPFGLENGNATKNAWFYCGTIGGVQRKKANAPSHMLFVVLHAHIQRMFPLFHCVGCCFLAFFPLGSLGHFA